MNRIARTNDLIKQIIDEMEFEYLNNMDMYTEDKKSIDFTLEYEEEGWNEITNIIINTKHALINLSQSHLNWFMHDRILHKKTAQDNFLMSSAYAFICYLYVKIANACIKSKDMAPLDVDTDFPFPDVARFLSQIQICKWWSKADSLGMDILNSINNQNPDSLEITDHGVRVNPIAWFIVDLFTISEGKWYIEKNAKHPSKNDYHSYQKALNAWDSTDINEVESIIYELCESHLHEIENKAIYDKKMEEILDGSVDHAIEIITDISLHSKYEDFAQRDLEDMSVKVFPYEVFSWLSVREKFGINNPKIFSHPLMNTELTDNFIIKDSKYPETNMTHYALKKFYGICSNLTINTENLTIIGKNPKY